MTIAPPFVEGPVWVPCGDDDLFGVMTNPTEPGRRSLAEVGVVLVTGGGSKMPGTHRNRMYVRMARKLAVDGLATLRFDFHGFGDSTGWTPKVKLGNPFAADVLAATSYLERCGFTRLVVAGSCFGARSVLSAASHVERLAGVALLVPPVRNAGSSRGGKTISKRTFANLRDPAKRRLYARLAVGRVRTLPARWRAAHRADKDDLAGVAPSFIEPLEQLVARRVPLLIMHGSEDPYYEHFTVGQKGALGRVLEQAGPFVRVVTTDGRLHAFPTVAGQNLTIDTVREWVVSLDPNVLR